MRCCLSGLLCGWLAFLPATAWGGTLPKEFTLGNYVPDNVWMFTHVVNNPARAAIDAEWSEVWDAVRDAGIHNDILDMIGSQVPAEDMARIRATIDRMVGLLGTVDWEGLVGREFAFAERAGRIPNGDAHNFAAEYIILMRGAPGSARKNAEAIRDLANEIIKMVSEAHGEDIGLQLTETTKQGARLWSLTMAGRPLPFSFNLIHRDDIVGLWAGQPPKDGGVAVMVQDVLAMMAGVGDRGPVAATPRFVAALKQVDTPTDQVAFFDIKSVLGSVRESLCCLIDDKGNVPESARRKCKTVHDVLAQLDLLDYIITSQRTKGRQTRTGTVVRIQPDKSNSPLVRLMLDRTPFDRFDEFVPSNATSFSLSGSVDLQRLYETGLSMFRKHAPGGESHIQRWKEFLSSVGFDPYEEIFSWWSGEMIKIELPAAVVTPFGGSDTVMMIRVKDTERAATRVNAAIDSAGAFLQSRGQSLMISPANVGDGGFRHVTHPMLAMMVNPVIGVHKGWLMVGTSAAAVKNCLAVANGDAPSIMKNERFQREGLSPKGAVLGASFTDLTDLGKQLGGAAAMVGMVGGMATASMPQEARPTMQAVLAIAAKIGPILQQIDFYSSKSCVTTYDGKGKMLSEQVVTYKPAAGPKTAQAR